MTYNEFFTTLWNTEIISWDSLVALHVLSVMRLVVFP